MNLSIQKTCLYPSTSEDCNFNILSYCTVEQLTQLRLVSKDYARLIDDFFKCQGFYQHYYQKEIKNIIKVIEEIEEKWTSVECIFTKKEKEQISYITGNTIKKHLNKGLKVLSSVEIKFARLLLHYFDRKIKIVDNIRSIKNRKLTLLEYYNNIFNQPNLNIILQTLLKVCNIIYSKMIGNLGISREEDERKNCEELTSVDLLINRIQINLRDIKKDQTILKKHVLCELRAINRCYVNALQGYYLLPKMTFENLKSFEEGEKFDLNYLKIYWDYLISQLKNNTNSIITGDLNTQSSGWKPFIFMKLRVTYIKDKVTYKEVIKTIWVDKGDYDYKDYSANNNSKFFEFKEGMYYNIISTANMPLPLKNSASSKNDEKKVNKNFDNSYQIVKFLKNAISLAGKEAFLLSKEPLFLCDWHDILTVPYYSKELLAAMVKASLKGLIKNKKVEFDFGEYGTMSLEPL